MRTKLLRQAEHDTDLKAVFDSFDARSVRVVEGLPFQVLVTGSDGLLGKALVETLSHQGVKVVGMDVEKRSVATTVAASVTNADAVAAAMAGCQGVIHTAALHAPDQQSFSEEDFHCVNVVGTGNILKCAASLCIPVVYTSTTSLMITKEVKTRMAGGETVWLDEESPQCTPRNKYGCSKLGAERRCLAGENAMPVVIVRTPRFFAEEDVGMSEGVVFAGTDNLRAFELFSGHRAALEDLVEAHLLALAKAQALDRRTFILCPTLPPSLQCLQPLAKITRSDLERAMGAEGIDAFTAAGWKLPEVVDRVYDGKAAHEALGWRPRWTPSSFIDRLVRKDPRALRAAF